MHRRLLDMAALQNVQALVCPEARIKWLCSRLRSRLHSSCSCVRTTFLPAISLTRTPGGHHLEWAGAFFEPCLERLEKGIYFVGLLCFILVLIGISTVVGTFYSFILPYLWHVQHPLIFSLYVMYGHYILINVCYHYFRGVYTDPGAAPKIQNFDSVTEELKKGWKFCRKCETPKPPRAHHCRICNKCVLKMDHHCPWMFNCVGHYNHRYFFSFVAFMWLGTCYVVHCAWAKVFTTMNVTNSLLTSIIGTFGMRSSLDAAAQLPHGSRTEHTLVLIVFFVCVGVTAALTILGGWHLYLISYNETTIEFYSNKRDTRDMRQEGLVFTNAYNYGCVNNWVVFLGLGGGRTFVRHVLLPSSHSPHHDGLEWEHDTVLCYKDKIRTIAV